MDMDAVSGMLPCDRRAPLPPRAPARPPKAHAVARIDWTIQDLPHKMATSPLEKELKASRDLIALYKEGIASKDADITNLRKERNILEAQIKASNALVKSANGMETLLQNELEAAIRVQNDLKKKLATAEAAQSATAQAVKEKVDHLSESMHALTLAQMDLQASQRERRNVETINTSLSNELSSAKKELAAKDGDILALKEALRIAQRAVEREAQRAVDEVNAPTLQKRLENTEKELKSVRAALRSAQKAPPTPEDTDWCLCNGTGQYVKRKVGNGWVSEVTTPCPAHKHYPPGTACKASTRLSADQIRQQRSTNGAGLCACPYVCSVHTKTPGQQVDAMGIPTHNPDGSELSRNKRKAYEAAHAAQSTPTPEPSKKPAPAPAQVLPRAHVAGDLLTTILQDAATKNIKSDPLNVTPVGETYKKSEDVSDDIIETLLEEIAKDTHDHDVPHVPLGDLLNTIFKGIHAKETSPDDAFLSLLKALDVVGKKTTGDDMLSKKIIESFAKGFIDNLKAEECNFQ